MSDTGYLALALANSKGSGVSPRGREAERLATPGDASQWLIEIGLRGPPFDRELGDAGDPVEPPDGRTRPTALSPTEARIVWQEARRLRRAALGLFAAHRAGVEYDEQDVHVMDRILGCSAARPTVRMRQGELRLEEHEVSADPVSVLAPVVRSIVELLGSVPRGRLRECASDVCHTWFVDTSRGGRRRWCSMAACGNRAKAARHRRRAASGT